MKEAGLLSMEELARQKNIELVYLPKYTPQINPIELCFNTTRHFTENLPTDGEEELEKSLLKKKNNRKINDFFIYLNK